MSWSNEKVREMLIGAATLEIVVAAGYENEGGFYEARQEATKAYEEWAEDLTLGPNGEGSLAVVNAYRDAYEKWHAEGQKLHSALLDVWRMVTPDSKHMTFTDPEEVLPAVQAAMRRIFEGMLQEPDPNPEPEGEAEPDVEGHGRMVPIHITKGALLATLDHIRRCVEADDSFEGSLEYTLPDEEPGFNVRASYRVGNSEGQGGMRVIGRLT